MESTSVELTEEELHLLSADGIDDTYDIPNVSTDEECCPESSYQDISSDEIAILSADAVDDEVAPDVPEERSNQATTQTRISKYFECTMCNQTLTNIKC